MPLAKQVTPNTEDDNCDNQNLWLIYKFCFLFKAFTLEVKKNKGDENKRNGNKNS